MKKWISLFWEELKIWLRGRFTLTEEEKFWLLLVLVVCWVGLTARYFHLKNQDLAPLTQQQIEELLEP